MRTIKISGNFLITTTALSIIFSFIFIQPISSEAAVSCNFDRNLEMNVDGEDVRCLQKYLNDAGFAVASSGPGSPGNETTLFRDATKAAVINWQVENSLAPSIGFFGPLSRAKYTNLTSGNSDTTVSTDSGKDQIAGLLSKLQSLQAQLDSAKEKENTIEFDDVSKEILIATNELKKAEDQIEDALDDGLSIGRADDNIIEARDDFYEAIIAFLGNNFQRALSFASYSIENSLDAFEDAGGESEEDEVENLIDDVDEKIDDAQDEIDQAEDDGKYVDKAEEILDDARDLLDEAEDQLRDDEIDEARDLAEDAEDLVEDSLDAIGSSDRRDAEDAIDDAADAIDDAWDDVRDADRDGQDVRDAENLLRDAEDELEDAEDAYDDDDYDEAVERAEEAEDLADEALDEI